LIQINEHLHEEVEFMPIISGVLHAAVAKRVEAHIAPRTGRLGIVLCRGAKDFSRSHNPDTRRIE
jgi:hypothetical protein